MANRLSGQRYAQAIFELALENEQVEQWDQDLRLASDVLQDEEFALFLKHAEVPTERKVAAIEAVLTETHPLVRNLVSLLVSRSGVDAIGDVQAGYSQLLDEHLGRQRVEVTAAVPLTDDELERINRFVSQLAGREIIITTYVDENLLGGLIIQDRRPAAGRQHKFSAGPNASECSRSGGLNDANYTKPVGSDAPIGRRRQFQKIRRLANGSQRTRANIAHQAAN